MDGAKGKGVRAAGNAGVERSSLSDSSRGEKPERQKARAHRRVHGGTGSDEQLHTLVAVDGARLVERGPAEASLQQSLPSMRGGNAHHLNPIRLE